MEDNSANRRGAAQQDTVAKLKDKLQTRRAEAAKDWRRTIGIFTDDNGMQQIMAEAMKLREADRRGARRRSTKRRKSGS